MERLLHAVEEEGRRNMAVAAIPIESSRPCVEIQIRTLCSLGLGYGDRGKGVGDLT